MTLSNNSQTKNHHKTPKKQKFNHSKSHVKSPNKKYPENKLQVKFKMLKNGIFENTKKLINNFKNTEKLKIKIIKILERIPQMNKTRNRIQFNLKKY